MTKDLASMESCEHFSCDHNTSIEFARYILGINKLTELKTTTRFCSCWTFSNRDEPASPSSILVLICTIQLISPAYCHDAELVIPEFFLVEPFILGSLNQHLPLLFFTLQTRAPPFSANMSLFFVQVAQHLVPQKMIESRIPRSEQAHFKKWQGVSKNILTRITPSPETAPSKEFDRGVSTRENNRWNREFEPATSLIWIQSTGF